jgi:hypothetical protein
MVTINLDVFSEDMCGMVICGNTGSNFTCVMD